MIYIGDMLDGKEYLDMAEHTETQRKILEIGKREFLTKGFKDASLPVSLRKLALLRGRFMDIIRTKQRFLRRWSPSLQMA